MGDNKDYDKAIESFKAIKEQKKPDWDKAKADLADKEAKLNAATTEDKKAEIEPEVSAAEDYLVAIQVGIAQIDYLIAHFMKTKIDETMQKRMQEFYDKKNKEPEKYKDLAAPEATPEEQAKADEMKKEMKTLLEEAVSFVDTPEPYYNALIGDLYLESKEWDKAHEQWAIVVDYVVSDPNLLQRASSAYNSFMDGLTDPARREKAGKEFDKLSTNLAKAQEEQKIVQEEQQKRFQKMIEEQMKQQGGEGSGSTQDTAGGEGTG